MNENKKGKQAFHSMMEFEKEYFPKSFEQKIEKNLKMLVLQGVAQQKNLWIKSELGQQNRYA